LHDLLFVPRSLLLFAAMQVVAQCLGQALLLRDPFGSLCRGQVRKIFHFAMQQKRDEHVKRQPASWRAVSVKHPPALPNLKAWYIRLGAARCRSSVVEHSLGKGEVESSILSGSTTSSIDIGRRENRSRAKPARKRGADPRALQGGPFAPWAVR
jgi:hypothetical protein